ncbi:MAG: aldehyde dehydrogenase [Elusimicrobia bacterium]|nr:aldehyde dehydrogenase [Elusimicrobiota bacterium]
MPVDEKDISRIVSEVLERLAAQQSVSGAMPGGGRRTQSSAPAGEGRPPSSDMSDLVFPSVEAAVSAAASAQTQFQELGLEVRRAVIKAMRKAVAADAERLARMAHEETGLGRWQDKVQKNLVCALKTPGVEDLQARAYTGDKGLTLVEFAPYGVVGAVTPSTNPTATIINNAISILSAGNAVVFAPHPASQRCCREAMRALHRAAVAAGAPAHIMATFDPVTQESTRALLSHPGVRVNMVTGGPAIVKIAMTTGKTCKTIAAGPGNPPVVVDETALFPQCVRDIVYGASFDNGILCTAEKEAIVVRAARERFLAAMRADSRAHELNSTQMEQLTRRVIVEGGRGCKEPKLNRDFVGKDAAVLALAIGLNLSEGVRLLWSEVPNDHPFVWTEQLMPVLPVTVVPDIDSAIQLAYEAEGENHHTAAMHSMNVDHLTRMGRRMQCSIYVKNAPTVYGLGFGEGYASMSIGTPTGDGLTKASHFARPLHCSLVGYFRIA